MDVLNALVAFCLGGSLIGSALWLLARLGDRLPGDETQDEFWEYWYDDKVALCPAREAVQSSGVKQGQPPLADYGYAAQLAKARPAEKAGGAVAIG